MSLALFAASAAAETPPVQLRVEGTPEASCATTETLRARVVTLLESDPFVSDGSRRIEVRFGPIEGGLKADIAFTEAVDQPEARRTLRTHGHDCEALLGAVALSVVLAVDPVRGLRLVAEAPSLDLPPPDPAPIGAPEGTSDSATRSAPAVQSDAVEDAMAEEASAALPSTMEQIELAPGEENDAPPAPDVEVLEQPRRPTPVMHDGISISGGVVGGLGSGLGADLALHLDWTVDVGALAFGTYLRWAPNFGFAHQGGTVEADLTTFGVHLCRRWARLAGCALASGGVQYARGTDGAFDPKKRIDAPYLAVGGRGAFRVWSAGPVSLSASAELFTPLSRLRILAQGTEVWSTPVASGHLGLMVAYVLP